MKRITVLGAFLISTVAAGDLHPIVEVQTGYLFGATADGKWMKAEQAAKALKAETTYRIYGLTQSFGVATGDEPKPEKGAIALAAPWNALPRKAQLMDPTQKVYADAVRDFLKTKRIEQPKVKIESIVRVDLDGDGEEEVLISATNYFQKDEGAPMRSPAGSYSMVLLRRVVTGKVQTQLVEGEFYPKATGYNAPNAYKVIAVLDVDGDGKLEVVVASQYYEGAATTIYRCDPKKVKELLSVACGV